MGALTGTDPTAAADAVIRIEFSRLVAALTRYCGNLDLAEDFAQDAIVEALEDWPRGGIPRAPGAWLMTVGKRRAVDYFRRAQNLERKYALLGPMAEDDESASAEFVDHIPDDELRLIFIACHPSLPLPSQVALTLRLVGGLTVPEIARAFLQQETAIAQRILRAKRSLADAAVPFEVPEGRARSARVEAVLRVVYLIFNEGYSATVGEDWMRPELCRDALRIGRELAALLPRDSEVHGLLALMEFQSSRLAARTDAAGDAVLLMDQDRRRWDRLHIHLGRQALVRAEALAGSALGPYALQAAIAARHAGAMRPEDTDWNAIVGLYAALARVQPSPIVELNRAVAISFDSGPAAALDLLDTVRDHPRLRDYHLLHSVRADLLARLGRADEAVAELELAATMTSNEREQVLLQNRAARLWTDSSAVSSDAAEA